MAIAFDAATSSTQVTGTSLTFSHTVGSGTNRILFVACGLPTSDLISGVTYNGTALTLIGKSQAPSPNTRFVYLFYLINPTSGAHNVVVTASSTSDDIEATASSYSGASVLGGIDNSTTNTTSGVTSITTSLTTVADNCWTIIVGRTNGTTMVVGTGVTSRGNMGDTTAIVGDSNGIVHPAGSKSMTIQWSGSGSASVVMASFAPFSPTTRNLSDSIMRGASRQTTISRSFMGTRMLSDFIMYGAGRLTFLVEIARVNLTSLRPLIKVIQAIRPRIK